MDEIIGNDPAAVRRLLDAVEGGKSVLVSEFARLVGRNETAIRRMWKTGSLPAGANGRIPVREGLVALMSNARKRPEFLVQAEARARELIGLEQRPAEPAGAAAPMAGALDDSGSDGAPAQWRLKLVKAQIAAKIATTQATQLRNDVERGRLISRADVELDAAETATEMAQALSRIPERVSGMCVGCTAEEIAGILRREISIVFDAVKRSAYTGDWEGVV